MNGRRKLALLLFGIAIVLLLGVGVIVIVPQLTSPSPSARSTPTIVTTRLPNADVARLEKALNNPDLHVQSTVMSPELASAYLTNGKPAYPAGSTVKVLQGKSVCKGDVCEIKAIVTVPGGVQTTFLLYLSNALGTWLIVDTEKES